MAKGIMNIGPSVRARFPRIAQTRGRTFDRMLIRYAIERLLYRLSEAPHADWFVLKGAAPIMTWFEEPFRGGRDLDFLGFGNPNPEVLLSVLKKILETGHEDGVRFDRSATRIDRVREDNDYGGLRIRTRAKIGGARIVVTVDIGFGDALESGAKPLNYPSMLDFPTPRLRGYARETVIAKKFQAMVNLGRANSRMKDFYDIWIISRSFDFGDARLPPAIAATFVRRGTPIPVNLPDALTPTFAADKQKLRQWRAFVHDVALDPGGLANVIDGIAVFLMPQVVSAVKRGTPSDTV